MRKPAIILTKRRRPANCVRGRPSRGGPGRAEGVRWPCFVSFALATSPMIQAAQATPVAARLSCPLLPPSAPWSLQSGGQHPRRGRRVRQGCRTNAGASSPRPVTRSVRCAPGPRVGPALIRPAGPRCARRLPRPPQPPPSRRVGERAAAETAGLGSVAALPREGRMAPRCAKPRARPGASGRRARGPKTTRPGPRRCAGAPLERLHGQRGDRSTSCRVALAPRRPFRRARSAAPRANQLRSLRSLRGAGRALPYASRPAFRSPAARDRCTPSASRRSLRSPLRRA